MVRPRSQRKQKQQASNNKGEGSPPKKQKTSEKGGEEKSSEQGVIGENPVVPTNLFDTSEEKDEAMNIKENKEEEAQARVEQESAQGSDRQSNTGSYKMQEDPPPYKA